MTCPEPSELVEERISRVLTQYRESPNLLHVLRTYLGAVASTALRVCDLPEHFDIETAVGDQLTILGRRMGWPRCHCVCDATPEFGFECDDRLTITPLAGFCEPGSLWAGCDTPGLAELCINDDETYRLFLKVRRYQYLTRYDLASLEEAVRTFFGPTAQVLYSGQSRVVIAPGRDLTPNEVALLQLYPRVMPVALGVRVMFHFGEVRVFGFGDGWGGFSEDAPEVTAANREFQRTGKVFGFCEEGDDSLGGFCEVWTDTGLPLETGELDQDLNPVLLVDEDNEPIYTGPLTEDAAWMCKQSAPWMCEVDVRPYSC